MVIMHSNIVFLTFNKMPSYDAGSVRMMAFADILVSLGYEINIISISKTENNNWVQLKKSIKHLSLRKHKKNPAIFIDYLLFNRNVNKVLKTITNIAAVFVFNTHFYVLRNKYLQKISPTLIYDATEWYSASEFKNSIFSFEYISNNLIVKKTKHPWKIVSISSFLHTYFLKRGLNSLLIPAIMTDDGMAPPKQKKHDKIVITYAGSPGKKDSLGMIIAGISALKEEELQKITLNIYGITKESFQRQNRNVCIPSSVHFYGCVDRKIVIERIKESDFTTFLRDPQMRFSKAGFPSKLVESFSCGVPVITNLSSDLNKYLIDFENSIIVKEYSPNSYANAIKSALILSDESLTKMGINSKTTFNNCFSISLFKNSIKTYIK